MCAHEHTSSVPCLHMNTPAAYQQRTMSTHEHTSSVPAAYHVYTWTYQQRTSSVPCVHMNTNVGRPHPTPPHPTPPQLFKIRANPPGRPNMLFKSQCKLLILFSFLFFSEMWTGYFSVIFFFASLGSADIFWLKPAGYGIGKCIEY